MDTPGRGTIVGTIVALLVVSGAAGYAAGSTAAITGPQGEQGPAGIQGPAGNPGPIGAQGPAGEDGAIGPTGPKGTQGVRGLTGIAGADGAEGAEGPPGADGVDGAADTSPWATVAAGAEIYPPTTETKDVPNHTFDVTGGGMMVAYVDVTFPDVSTEEFACSFLGTGVSTYASAPVFTLPVGSPATNRLAVTLVLPTDATEIRLACSGTDLFNPFTPVPDTIEVTSIETTYFMITAGTPAPVPVP